MKKRLSLFICIFLLVFSFAGCGSKKDAIDYDAATLEQIAQAIVTNFNSWDEETFNNFKEGSDLQVNLTLMQSGFPVEREEFIGMINSWQAAIDECGAFKEIGTFEIEERSDSVILKADAKYADRDATVEFKFDEKLNMESMDISAHYTTGEILEKAGMNTILGMGTVFAVLIFLAFLISLIKYIPMALEKMRKKEDTSVSAAKAETQTAEEAVSESVDDLELIAVITAAIAAGEGTSTDGFVVRSIRRRTSNKWN